VVFGGLYIEEWMLWLIPLGFYVADNTKTLADHEMIFLEDWTLRWTFRLDKQPFLVRNRHLYVLSLPCPHTIAVKLSWFRPGKPARQGVPDFRRRLVRWRRSASALRTIGVLSFLLLFAAAPLMTVYLGLFNTLLVLLPVHAGLVVLAAGWLCLRRRALGMRRWQVAGAIAEIVLVPGYLPNVFRRTAWATLGGDVDGIALIQRLARTETTTGLVDAVRFRLSEEWLGAEDALADDLLIRAYRRELGI